MENCNLWMWIILNRKLFLYIQLFDYSRRYWTQSLYFVLTVVKEVGASLQELCEESSRPDGLSDFHGGGFPWMWHSLGSYGQSEPPLFLQSTTTQVLCVSGWVCVMSVLLRCWWACTSWRSWRRTSSCAGSLRVSPQRRANSSARIKGWGSPSFICCQIKR